MPCCLAAGRGITVRYGWPTAARAEAIRPRLPPTADIFVPSIILSASNLQMDLKISCSPPGGAGYVVEITVIGSRTDLGAVPQLFGHPRGYARFLGGELRLMYGGRLIIVMPQGVGARGVSRPSCGRCRAFRSPRQSTTSCARGMAAVRRAPGSSG